MNGEKLVPKLRFPGFNNEWNKEKICNLFEIKNGLNKGKDFFGKGISILNYMDVNLNVLNTENSIKGLVDVNETEMNRYSVKNNDLFFTRTSETSDEIGLTSVYIGKSIKCVFSGFILRARPLNTNINSLFFAYCLRNTRNRYNIIKHSSITTRALISGSILSQMKINFPNISEQEKIANFLSAVDKKIEYLTQFHENYIKFKKGLLQQIFTQKIQFKKDLYETCELDVNFFKDLMKKGKAGGTPKSTKKSYYDGEMPFLSISDMTNQGKYIWSTEKLITDEGLNNSSAWIIPKNSLLYSIYASVGFVAINKVEITTSQAIFGIILKSNMDLEFVYYYLCYYQQFIHRMIETGTQGNLNSKIVKNMSIPVPLLEEQEKISIFLSAVDKKIDLIQSQIDKINMFKKSLLQQMFI